MNRASFARWRNLLLGLLISTIFLWLALRDLDWSAVGAVLQNARWGYLLPVFAVWTAGLAVRAVRWRVLLGDRVGLGSAFHILNIGFLINNVLPFRVGDLARAYLVARDEAPVSGWAALSTVVTERILDMLCVVLLLAAVLPVLPVDPAVATGGLALGGIALGGFTLLLLFAHRPARVQAWAERLLGLLPAHLRARLIGLLVRMLDGLRPLTTWRGLWGAALWTAAGWFCTLFAAWLLGLVFPDLPATDVVRAALTLAVVAASFSFIIPFTLANVGPFEAASIFALMAAAVPQELAAAYAVVWHTTVVPLYALWGAVGLLALGLSLGQVRRGAASLAEPTPGD